MTKVIVVANNTKVNTLSGIIIYKDYTPRKKLVKDYTPRKKLPVKEKI
jgi:hypothetical protein